MPQPPRRPRRSDPQLDLGLTQEPSMLTPPAWSALPTATQQTLTRLLTQRNAHPRDRPDGAMLCDEGELHIASLAKYAAAFPRMSRSAFRRATSLRSRSISICSGFIWP
ncbi:hypothetical protein GMJLKIPL_5570 [Methylobacterium isbiliense]|uniref:Uncharacterized protein n=1 Tax=Methylobacterium isbiliense TaxID=315478 RepID=A0ABQ4SMF2_9HYPH|nr:hypothetical protein GMJLKIPL_5570 [Methylobacterium isbiliense]